MIKGLPSDLAHTSTEIAKNFWSTKPEETVSQLSLVWILTDPDILFFQDLKPCFSP